MQGKIDPANCEAYFLLYVDNELSNTERAAVEAFLQQHPEMKPLLEELMGTRQAADPLIVFPDRSKLFFDALQITDEELLSYLDKEPVPDTVQKKLQHLSPELAERLQAFEKTVSAPDMQVVFPDKTRLYRNPKLAAFKKWGMAAAAVAIMAVGAAVWIQDREERPGLAGTDLPRDTASGAAIARVTPEEEAPADTMPTAGNTEKKPADATDAPAADYRDDRPAVKAAVRVSVPSVTRNTITIAEQPLPAPHETDLPHQPETRPLVAKPDPGRPAVTEPDPSEPGAMAATGNENQPKTKKSLFKKLTQRIEERVTETLTDHEGQVNIAGFAVNVK